MTQRKISKKEAEAILKKYKSKPNVLVTITMITVTGLVWLCIAAAYKALGLYLFGG